MVYEIALELKGLIYVVGELCLSADMRHGPLTIEEPGFPVVVISPPGEVYDDILGRTRRLAEPGTELMVIPDACAVLHAAGVCPILPARLPASARCTVLAIQLQLRSSLVEPEAALASHGAPFWPRPVPRETVDRRYGCRSRSSAASRNVSMNSTRPYARAGVREAAARVKAPAVVSAREVYRFEHAATAFAPDRFVIKYGLRLPAFHVNVNLVVVPRPAANSGPDVEGKPQRSGPRNES